MTKDEMNKIKKLARHLHAALDALREYLDDIELREKTNG